jgi:hypothetical protein
MGRQYCVSRCLGRWLLSQLTVTVRHWKFLGHRPLVPHGCRLSLLTLKPATMSFSLKSGGPLSSSPAPPRWPPLPVLAAVAELEAGTRGGGWLAAGWLGKSA